MCGEVKAKLPASSSSWKTTLVVASPVEQFLGLFRKSRGFASWCVERALKVGCRSVKASSCTLKWFNLTIYRAFAVILLIFCRNSC